MKRSTRIFLKSGSLIAFGVLLHLGLAHAQGQQEPGRPIGAISTQGDLIVMQLDEGALAGPNLFDLVRRTLRFTPDGPGYRAENLALQWDAEFGAELTGAQVALHNFTFPYSGKNWDSFSVGTPAKTSIS